VDLADGAAGAREALTVARHRAAHAARTVSRGNVDATRTCDSPLKK
jgi:hypothetical protein